MRTRRRRRMPRRRRRAPNALSGGRVSRVPRGAHGYRGTVAVQRAIMADTSYVRMVYCEQYVRANAGPETYVWSHNSIHDPDFTGTGHQPRGHDEWAMFYRRYYVYAARCEVSIANTGITPVIAVLSATAQNNGNYANIARGVEQPNTRHVIVPRDNRTPAKLSYYITTSELIGHNTAYERDYAPTFGLDPNTRTFFRFGLDTMPAINAKEVEFHVKITYYVRLDERVVLPDS